MWNVYFVLWCLWFSYGPAIDARQVSSGHHFKQRRHKRLTDPRFDIGYCNKVVLVWHKVNTPPDQSMAMIGVQFALQSLLSSSNAMKPVRDALLSLKHKYHTSPYASSLLPRYMLVPGGGNIEVNYDQATRQFKVTLAVVIARLSTLLHFDDFLRSQSSNHLSSRRKYVAVQASWLCDTLKTFGRKKIKSALALMGLPKRSHKVPMIYTMAEYNDIKSGSQAEHRITEVRCSGSEDPFDSTSMPTSTFQTATEPTRSTHEAIKPTSSIHITRSGPPRLTEVTRQAEPSSSESLVSSFPSASVTQHHVHSVSQDWGTKEALRYHSCNCLTTSNFVMILVPACCVSFALTALTVLFFYKRRRKTTPPSTTSVAAENTKPVTSSAV